MNKAFKAKESVRYRAFWRARHKRMVKAYRVMFETILTINTQK